MARYFKIFEIGEAAFEAGTGDTLDCSMIVAPAGRAVCVAVDENDLGAVISADLSLFDAIAENAEDGLESLDAVPFIGLPACDGCPDKYGIFDAKDIYANGEKLLVDCTVRCGNLPRCRRMMERFKGEGGNG